VRLDEIQFVRFDNDDTEEHAFRAGQVDVTMTVPFTKLEPYAHEHPDELHRASIAETRFLSFNTQRPPLGDARVRRALSFALDRARLVERVTRGGQRPAVNFLPPALAIGRDGSPRSPELGASNAAATDGSESRPHPVEARALLAAAGFAEGKNFPRLTLTAWSPSQTPVLEAIQAMWRQELGLDAAIAIREARVQLAALVSGDYDIAFATTAPLLDVADPVALLENFSGASLDNYPRWHSAEFDRALAEGDVAGAERLLLAAAPVAPLYFNTHNWLMSPRVQGWQEDALWSRSYLHVYLDEK